MSEYENLALGVISLEAKLDTEVVVKRLRALVRAGRRYAMLAEKFGARILLALPTSIGKTT